jgi:glycosyltransferase involved in cell wall biosynthesis
MRVVIHRQGFGATKPKGFGGMETQQAETIKWLERLGVEVLTDWNKAHIIHFFGIYNNTPRQIAQAHALRKKVVVSTIYWPHDEMHRSNPRRLSWLRQRFRWSFREADLLLPNSHIEAQTIMQEYQVRRTKMRVVVNAVPPDINEQTNGNGLEPWEHCGLKDYVLIVGRNEGRKNQHAFLRAMQDVNVPILMVGDCYYETQYYWACWEMAQRRKAPTEFFAGVPPPKLWHYMKRAKLVAQPSIYETPGLVVLEAAALGVPIAPTNRGTAREYFGDLVEYLDPFSDESMRRCMRAVDQNTEQLKTRVLQRYTWEMAARQTLKAYQEVLGRWLG